MIEEKLRDRNVLKKEKASGRLPEAFLIPVTLNPKPINVQENFTVYA
jgi:hypothetical protein